MDAFACNRRGAFAGARRCGAGGKAIEGRGPGHRPVDCRYRLPLDWAAAQNNLGSALRALGDLERSAATIREGRTAVARAAEVYAAEGYVQFAPLFAERLAEFDAAISEQNNP